MSIRGLICAGGEATRLEELTRASNKHLLPVGRWPMIYYPLQLLQMAGIREVLIVTGQGHAGQLIDLLGDGCLSVRNNDGPLFELDLTYKVQTSPGGIAQVVGMAEGFAAGGKLVVCLGDNLFEYSQSAALREYAKRGAGAMVFVKEVPDPERFGVVDTRFDRPPSSHAVVGLYCYPPDVFDVIEKLAPSIRGELEITDVNRHYALAGRLDASEVAGWWEDAGKHWKHLADIGRRIDETGANKRDPA